jgi:hypothetical protein
MSARTAAFAALFMSIAFTLMFTSAASASWFIEGEELAEGKTAALATTAPIDEFPILRINPAGGAAEVEVQCQGASLTAETPYISGPNGVNAKSLTFERCKVTKPTSGCELEAEGATKNLRKITTNQIKATVAEGPSFPDDRLTFMPQTKNTLTTLPFVEGETCLGGIGPAPVKGSVTLNASSLQEELVTQTVVGLGSLENNSLEVAGDKTILEGGLALVKLATGKPFKGPAPILALAIGEEDYGTRVLTEKVTAAIGFTANSTIKYGSASIDPIGGGTFAITGNSCSGNSFKSPEPCVIDVEWDPTAMGVSNADLLVNVSDTAAPNKEVKMVRLVGKV